MAIFASTGPPIPGFADYGNDILEETRSWKDPRGAWAEIGDPQLVARLVCFSSTIGGDACFGIPRMSESKRSHEYGIYVRNRDSSGDEVKKAAASSFKEFVERHCLAKRSFTRSWAATAGIIRKTTRMRKTMGSV